MIRPPVQSRNRSVRRRHGFTLVEVLLVLAILGVIAAMVVPNLLGRQQDANKKATVMSIKSLEDAVKQYAIANNGDFPKGIADLQSRQDASGNAISPYLEKAPKDAWGNLLNYDPSKGDGIKPGIWSNGLNRTDDSGSGDDINNWTN